jgi:hypothetical protein
MDDNTFGALALVLMGWVWGWSERGSRYWYAGGAGTAGCRECCLCCSSHIPPTTYLVLTRPGLQPPYTIQLPYNVPLFHACFGGDPGKNRYPASKSAGPTEVALPAGLPVSVCESMLTSITTSVLSCTATPRSLAVSYKRGQP